MNFYNFLLLLWVIFALLDPDPDLDSEYGSGSTGPTEYGSNPDPDTDPDSKPSLRPCEVCRGCNSDNRGCESVEALRMLV
jgi:hypothetical protein